MKRADRDENDQTGMAPLIEYRRVLRDDSGSTVLFVHHTGHQGTHMRGSSDLESAWETRLTWTRDGQSPTVTVAAEHREAEPGEPIQYRIAWDTDTRSMRFDLEPDALDIKVAVYLHDNPDASANDVYKHIGGNRPKVLATVKAHREQGGTK